MIFYTVYNKNSGEILRAGQCQELDFLAQVQTVDEEVRLGAADDLTKKIDTETYNIINKTLEELEDEKPDEIPTKDRQARITNKELSTILARLDTLEGI